MFTINRTKLDKVNFKEVTMSRDGILVNEDGEEISLLDAIRKAFGDDVINITIARKSFEKINVDEDEVDYDEETGEIND